MIYDYQNFVTSQNWSGASVKFSSNDTTRAKSLLDGNSNYTYDKTVYGVQSLSGTVIQQAFNALLKDVNFSAVALGGSEALANAGISISLVKDLKSNGVTIAGVQLGDVSTNNVSVIINNFCCRWFCRR